MMPRPHRRDLLKALAATGALAATSGVAFAAPAAARPRDLLVVIFQRGACDGLHLVGPAADPAYVEVRPAELRVTEGDERPGHPLANSLDDRAGFHLHHDAAGLAELYGDRSLAILHAVGLTTPQRSHFVAQDLHHKLFRVGRNVFLMADAHEAWTAAVLSPAHTVAIGFSHSGTTADTVQFLNLARENGARTVAITGARESPLARAAEERLITHARESTLRAGAMVSRIAQLALVDCLFMGIARLRYEQTIDALKRTRDVTHPDHHG